MSAWPEGGPDHYWSPGCCEQDRYFHLWSPQESREVGEWLDTEPGMIDRLERRQAQLHRMEELGAPEIILENQRRLVREMEEKLDGQTGTTP